MISYESLSLEEKRFLMTSHAIGLVRKYWHLAGKPLVKSEYKPTEYYTGKQETASQRFNADLIERDNEVTLVYRHKYDAKIAANTVERKNSGFIAGKKPQTIAYQRRKAFKAMADQPKAIAPTVERESVPASEHSKPGNGLLVKRSAGKVIANMPMFDLQNNGIVLLTPSKHGDTIYRMSSSSDMLAKAYGEKNTFHHTAMRSYGVPIAQQFANLVKQDKKLTGQAIAAEAKGKFERASNLRKQIDGNRADMRELAEKLAAMPTAKAIVTPRLAARSDENMTPRPLRRS